MSKETKQERIVRTMTEQMTEHLHELKAFGENPNVKESDVERWCQSILKNCLGFTVLNGYSIRSQEARGKSRPDLVVEKNGKPVIVIEVKKLGFDFSKSDFRSGKVQLSEYLKNIGSVKWGLLCNGYEWKLFDFTNPTYGGIEIRKFDLRNIETGELETGKREMEDSCWDFVDLHETTYVSGEWEAMSKEETAFSPESLAKAILSYDSAKYLAKVIRGEYEYKANVEMLIEKLYVLLEQGLNDTDGWNDTMKAEFSKFIKSQKRVGRKKKRGKKEEVAVIPILIKEEDKTSEPVLNAELTPGVKVS
jgi:hypothetical protein